MNAALSKQIGPFPLGIWIVVIGGGLGIGLLARKRTATVSAAPADAEYTTAGGTDLNTLGGAAGGYTTTAGQGVLATTPLISTNEDWRTAAERELLARNINPTTADSAVGKYLTGGALTQAEQAIIDIALQYAGPTPYLVPTITQAPVTPVPANVQPAVLPKINSADWDLSLPGDAAIKQVGVGGPGGFYQGVNVSNGAPVYAYIGDKWVQNWDPNKLPQSTKLGIPQQLAGYAGSEQVTEDFTP